MGSQAVSWSGRYSLDYTPDLSDLEERVGHSCGEASPEGQAGDCHDSEYCSCQLHPEQPFTPEIKVMVLLHTLVSEHSAARLPS